MIYTSTTQNKFRKYNVSLTVEYKDIISKRTKTPLRSYHIQPYYTKGHGHIHTTMSHNANIGIIKGKFRNEEMA